MARCFAQLFREGGGQFRIIRVTLKELWFLLFHYEHDGPNTRVPPAMYSMR
jgi:hypothetical protein